MKENKVNGLHIVTSEEDDTPKTIELTEEQEERWDKRFFLLYHMHLQPSEYENLSEIEREWLLQRFIHQKQAEKQMVDEIRRGPISNVPVDFLREIEKTKNR